MPDLTSLLGVHSQHRSRADPSDLDERGTQRRAVKREEADGGVARAAVGEEALEAQHPGVV